MKILIQIRDCDFIVKTTSPTFNSSTIIGCLRKIETYLMSNGRHKNICLEINHYLSDLGDPKMYVDIFQYTYNIQIVDDIHKIGKLYMIECHDRFTNDSIISNTLYQI